MPTARLYWTFDYMQPQEGTVVSGVGGRRVEFPLRRATLFVDDEADRDGLVRQWRVAHPGAQIVGKGSYALEPPPAEEIAEVDEAGVPEFFEVEQGLAHLLLEEVVFANGRRFVQTNGEIGEETVLLFVNCGDTFAYACADAEALPYREVQALYDAWVRHGYSGVVAWIAHRRKRQPIPERVRSLKKRGLWSPALEGYPAWDEPTPDR